jgi:hypothetical protein
MSGIPDIMKIPVVSALLVILSCSSSPVERVRQYEANHNSHDVDATLTLFAVDFRYEMMGSWVAEGREQMRKFEEWDASINSELSFDNFETAGDTVICTVTERNDWFTLVGVDAIYYDCVTIVFHDNLMSEIIAEQSRESMLAAQTAFESFIDWAVAEHPEELAELMHGPTFEFSKDTAPKWLMLLREWRQQIEQFDRITQFTSHYDPVAV